MTVQVFTTLPQIALRVRSLMELCHLMITQQEGKSKMGFSVIHHTRGQNLPKE